MGLSGMKGNIFCLLSLESTSISIRFVLVTRLTGVNECGISIGSLRGADWHEREHMICLVLIPESSKSYPHTYAL
jgi:hypothetical protein